MWPACPPFAGRSTPLRTAERQVRFASHRPSELWSSFRARQDCSDFPGDAGHPTKKPDDPIQERCRIMLENFGMSKGGKEYRRLVAAFERTFGATIFFGTDSLTSNAKVVHRSRFNFFSEARIWYNHGNNRLPGEPYENVIVLSNEFFKDVTAHPIPTDLEAVMLLSSAPAVLDLFVWLSYRCFTSKGPECIPIFGPFGLVQQLGAVEYARPRKFRERSSNNGSKRYGCLAGMPCPDYAGRREPED
jgi:hypothetical protein